MRALVIALFFAGSFLNAQKIATSLTYSVVSPKNTSSKTPVLILLHGYGGDENDLMSLTPGLDKKFLIFSLRGPENNGQGGPCWFPLEFLAGQKFRYDYDLAVKSRQKIISFVTSACRAYKADSTQVYLLGYSQGAIIAYDAAFAAPEKIKGVVALSGLLMPQTASRKIDLPKFKKCSFFIAHGTQDNIVNYNDGRSAAQEIEKTGARVIFKSYVAPHTITSAELADINKWLMSEVAQISDRK